MTTATIPGEALLDGELSLAELPPELRAEGEEALRLWARRPRAGSRCRRRLRRALWPPSATLHHPHRLARQIAPGGGSTPRGRGAAAGVRPWTVWAGALAAAAARPAAWAVQHHSRCPAPRRAAAWRDPSRADSCCNAPGARRVAMAGTFNQWDRAAAPLVPRRAERDKMASLPVGQHPAFV